METTVTRGTQASTATKTLAMSLELSASKWNVFFTPGVGQRPRERTIAAGAMEDLWSEIERAKERFGLGRDARVVSCYEAGRDGFWVHRALEAKGIENLVVDSSSIEMPRRGKRAKTDRLDGRKLLAMLLRYLGGEHEVWRVVRVPSEEQEDARQLHRAREALKSERTRLINRVKGLLASQGIRLRVRGSVAVDLERVRRWDGQPLPEGLLARVRLDLERLEVVDKQFYSLERERVRRLRTKGETGPTKAQEQIEKLTRLNGIGPVGAWVPVHEVFAWREIRNRREIGALMGLTPTPWASGGLQRDQGISKAGSGRLRALAVELAWGWLRYQPRSELSIWYQRRFGHGSSRLRRIGIVAMARKLMIALWRYLESGVVPAGATIKA
jgi:transposase